MKVSENFMSFPSNLMFLFVLHTGFIISIDFITNDIAALEQNDWL